MAAVDVDAVVERTETGELTATVGIGHGNLGVGGATFVVVVVAVVVWVAELPAVVAAAEEDGRCWL